MKKIIFILLALAIISCTNNDDAQTLLQSQGYTDIEFTGYSWFECSKDDWYHTGFKAKGPNGTVEGTVCEGLLFKGKTIRFE